MRIRPLLHLRQAKSMFAALSLVALCTGVVLPQEVMAANINWGLFPRSPLSETLLLAKAPAARLPASVVSALQQDISKRTGVQPQTIRVVETAQKTWPDGCLGLAKSDEMCTQALVSGWRVVLSKGSRRWVYRTNASGKVFRLETPAQRSSLPLEQPLEQGEHKTIKPAQISIRELPPKLQSDVLVRSVSSGGFAGRTYQTILLKDGRVIRSRVFPNEPQENSQVHQLSQAQFQNFQQFLQSHSLRPFHRHDYLATPGSADFITVTLTTSMGTIRYADSIQHQLPKNLQAVIQAWNEVSRFS